MPPRPKEGRTNPDLLSESSQKRTEATAPIGALILAFRRRGCTGNSARPATHGCADRRARRASDRNRHDTPDCRAEAGARYPAFHGASARIRVPMSILIVVSAVVGGVGKPVNMFIILVGVVPIGVVVDDRPVRAVGIQAMHPPAITFAIACDIGPFIWLGAGYRGDHQGCGCARNSEKRTQSKRSLKPSHVLPFFAASHIRQISRSF